MTVRLLAFFLFMAGSVGDVEAIMLEEPGIGIERAEERRRCLLDALIGLGWGVPNPSWKQLLEGAVLNFGRYDSGKTMKLYGYWSSDLPPKQSISRALTERNNRSADAILDSYRRRGIWPDQPEAMALLDEERLNSSNPFKGVVQVEASEKDPTIVGTVYLTKNRAGDKTRTLPLEGETGFQFNDSTPRAEMARFMVDERLPKEQRLAVERRLAVGFHALVLSSEAQEFVTLAASPVHARFYQKSWGFYPMEIEELLGDDSPRAFFKGQEGNLTYRLDETKSPVSRNIFFESKTGTLTLLHGDEVRFIWKGKSVNASFDKKGGVFFGFGKNKGQLMRVKRSGLLQKIKENFDNLN